MNTRSLDWLHDYDACALLTEAKSATERLGFFGNDLTNTAIVKQLAYRLGVETQ